MNKPALNLPAVAELDLQARSRRAPLSHVAANGNSSRRFMEPVGTRLAEVGDIESLLAELHEKYLPLVEGKPSKSVPKGMTRSDAFAICAVTVKGEIFQIGNASEEFPILSIAKPFVFGMALKNSGPDLVRKKIGLEPTGTAFNGLIHHEGVTQRRFNPLVNPGAIVTTSLIKGDNPTARQGRMLKMLESYAGRAMQIDPYMVEYRQRNDALNRSMAYFMQSEGLLEAPVEETLALYDAQCSVRVRCADLATMAATLANSGINPLTGAQAIAGDNVKNLLSVMLSGGLYDLSGQWAYNVGLPAKSGLAGAILAVIPGKMGVAVYSPPLGSHSKSLRGVKVLTELSERLNAHIFRGSGATTIAAAPSVNGRRRPKLVSLLDEVHSKYAPLRDGKPYVCDPGVTKVDPDRFGICAVSVDGQVQAVGDWQYPFLLQSISKVFVYGMALEDHGRDYVLRRVDVEPTGEAFDAIIKLEEKTKRPFNPMVNTGGIATTSLIKGRGRAQRLQRVLQMYSRYVGQEVRLDAPALLAEQSSGDRNRAISYLLRNFGMVSGAVEETLDLYLQQCSVIVTARDLAIMAATLAGGGVNPMTGQRAIAGDYVKDLLSVMYTCGMYDFAGAWAYHVGLPAKSGVGGGIMVVVPGEMGIAVYSPRLDERGNSVRGIRVFKDLSKRLGLHTFEPGRN